MQPMHQFQIRPIVHNKGHPIPFPSYIRIRAIVWACGPGQTDRHTQRQTRAWRQYISHHLRLIRNVIRKTWGCYGVQYMEEADKNWMIIRIGEWVNVSSGTGSPGQSWTKGRKKVVVVARRENRKTEYDDDDHVFLQNNKITTKQRRYVLLLK